MLMVMVAFAICWTPATLMTLMLFFGVPYHSHPIIDILAAGSAIFAAVVGPILNMTLFQGIGSAAVKAVTQFAPGLATVLNDPRLLLTAVTTTGATATSAGMEDEIVQRTGASASDALVNTLHLLDMDAADSFVRSHVEEHFPTIEESTTSLPPFIADFLVHQIQVLQDYEFQLQQSTAVADGLKIRTRQLSRVFSPSSTVGDSGKKDNHSTVKPSSSEVQPSSSKVAPTEAVPPISAASTTPESATPPHGRLTPLLQVQPNHSERYSEQLLSKAHTAHACLLELCKNSVDKDPHMVVSKWAMQMEFPPGAFDYRGRYLLAFLTKHAQVLKADFLLVKNLRVTKMKR
jgi:hypothetical protein